MNFYHINLPEIFTQKHRNSCGIRQDQQIYASPMNDRWTNVFYEFCSRPQSKSRIGLNKW